MRHHGTDLVVYGQVLDEGGHPGIGDTVRLRHLCRILKHRVGAVVASPDPFRRCSSRSPATRTPRCIARISLIAYGWYGSWIRYSPFVLPRGGGAVMVMHHPTFRRGRRFTGPSVDQGSCSAGPLRRRHPVAVPPDQPADALRCLGRHIVGRALHDRNVRRSEDVRRPMEPFTDLGRTFGPEEELGHRLHLVDPLQVEHPFGAVHRTRHLPDRPGVVGPPVGRQGPEGLRGRVIVTRHFEDIQGPHA